MSQQVTLFSRSHKHTKEEVEDFWDDSELLAAYNRQLEAYRNVKDGREISKDNQEEEWDDDDGEDVAPAQVTPGAIQLPPEILQDPSLAELITSWYNAGYRTGYYAATMKREK